MLIALYCLLKDDIITKMILGIWLINALCKAVEIYKGDIICGIICGFIGLWIL